MVYMYVYVCYNVLVLVCFVWLVSNVLFREFHFFFFAYVLLDVSFMHTSNLLICIAVSIVSVLLYFRVCH